MLDDARLPKDLRNEASTPVRAPTSGAEPPAPGPTRTVRVWRRLVARTARRFVRVLPPNVYRSLYGYGRLGYVPNYVRPRTFNEKVTWWLREARDPRLPARADKLAVRDFVAERAPWVRLPEVYAVAEDAAAFPFDALPDLSVFKANHGWNQVRVLRRPFEVDEVRALGASWLRHRHGKANWEWHFLTIAPRVYAEQYLGGPDGEPPLDFKVLVFNGVARFVQVFLNRGDQLRRVTFDRAWRVVPVWRSLERYGPADVVAPEFHPPRPAQLDAMLRAAEALAEDVPFVRVDFYVLDEELYFGELTYFPAAGYMPFFPESADRAWGDLLDVGSPPA